MSRLALGGLFALFTTGTAIRLAESGGRAAAHGGARAWLLVAFWLLKLGIVVAFAYFVTVRPAPRRPAREPVAFAACAAAVLGAVALGAPGAAGSTGLLLVGVVVALTGALWLLASVLALGRCFGFLPEARGLVTRGPYRLVRHPVYLGELTMAAGLVAAAPGLRNALAGLTLLGGQLVRMRLEERALEREFPAYAEYAERTPALLPALRPRVRAAVAAGGAALLAIALLAGGPAAPAGAKGKTRHKAAHLAAPRPVTPADQASVTAVPGFGWRPVSRAAKYEFQLSADPAFRSIVDQGAFFTRDTYASVPKTLADGAYYWRVRAVDAGNHAGGWSPVRALDKGWTDRPVLLGPPDGGTVSYPRTPLVLRWAGVPYAYKYVVTIATDPALAHSALGDRTPSVETSATSLALPVSLAPGRYYWGVTPEDSEKHPGRPSAVGSFDWSWPTQTTTTVDDINADPRVYDPRFSWAPVAGAAQYQVEVNSSEDFAVGSRVCCDDAAYGTSLSPTKILPNNTYYWRVRAVDMEGNAGVWNIGPSFVKTFDEAKPNDPSPQLRQTIPDLRLRDNLDHAPPAGPSGLPVTTAPVIKWSPVPGASSYEVMVAPWESPGFCDWTQDNFLVPNAHGFLTAATAWTQLGPGTIVKPVGDAFPFVATDGAWHLWDGTSYCVRVRARTDRDAKNTEVLSDWTQLGGAGHAAFTYSHPRQDCNATGMPDATYYLGPRGGTVSRTPVFTWRAVPGACGYFVVVARDPDFTKIVDVALTDDPAYAPRTGYAPTTYPDETTSYYWAVMPTQFADGVGLSTEPLQDFPQQFQKRSTPPTLLAPSPGSAIATQPAFQWTAAEGARSYRLQVDDDPSFGSPIVDVTTDSTSYTSTSALPADSRLYWRVRADDENGVGLTWSATGTFRRQFPVPVLPANPTSGTTIPTLSWLPVDGAVSYDVHVEQADGTKRDFTMRATAFTPIVFYGTGVWHWQVRANFRSGARLVSGGYSPMSPFTRQIATPTAIRTVKANGGALLSWAPAPQALRYRVQISTDDSFSTVIEQADVSNANYAPRMLAPAYLSGSKLWWRVATVDEGYNVGGWTAAPLQAARRLKLSVSGRLRAQRAGRLRIRVTGQRGRSVGRATVRAIGAGLYTAPVRTSGAGRLKLRLKPAVKGTLKLTAQKPGYAPATATVRVR